MHVSLGFLLASATGLCHASLLLPEVRQRINPSISISSTTLLTATSHAAEVTPRDLFYRAILPECIGFVQVAVSSASGSASANASSQLSSASSALAASASALIASIQSSASDQLNSASSSLAAANSLASASQSASQPAAQSASSTAGAGISASVPAETPPPSASEISVTATAALTATAEGQTTDAASLAAISQLADANAASKIATSYTIPATVAVVLIIVISVGSSVISVLVYRYLSRGKGPKSGRPDSQQTTRIVSSSSFGDNGINYYGRDVKDMKHDLRLGESEIPKGMSSDDKNGWKESIDIDIEKDIAQAASNQMIIDHEEQKRVSDLSRSSKSISALFTPRGVPVKMRGLGYPQPATSKNRSRGEDTVEVMVGIDNGNAGGRRQSADLAIMLSPSVYQGSTMRSNSDASQTALPQPLKLNPMTGGEKEKKGKFRVSIGKAY